MAIIAGCRLPQKVHVATSFLVSPAAPRYSHLWLSSEKVSLPRIPTSMHLQATQLAAKHHLTSWRYDPLQVSVPVSLEVVRVPLSSLHLVPVTCLSAGVAGSPGRE